MSASYGWRWNRCKVPLASVATTLAGDAFVKFEPRPADISVVEVALDDPTFVAARNRHRLRRIRVICTDVGSGSPATSIRRVDT